MEANTAANSALGSPCGSTSEIGFFSTSLPAAEAAPPQGLGPVKGKVIWVDFWASWCTPCRRSIPWLNAMHAPYGDRGLVIIGVNVDKDRREAERFLQQVPEYEHMLYEDGVIIVKFWFSISKEEQLRRFKSRNTNPLKQWKLSAIDEKAQNLWDVYSQYKEEMFSRTHTSFSPWIIVRANNKKKARLESMRYVLNTLAYDGKDEPNISIYPDPKIVRRFKRSTRQID